MFSIVDKILSKWMKQNESQLLTKNIGHLADSAKNYDDSNN